MFYVKYVVVDCTVTEYFECNEKNGITNDFLLIPATSFNCKAGENIQTFPPYTAFFFPKDTPFYYSPCKESYRDYFIHFISDDNFLTEYMIPTAQPIYLQDPVRIYNLIDMIAYENILNSQNKNEILNNLMKTLFIKISESSTYNTILPHYDELLKLRHNIFNHPERKWTLESISKSLHMSPGYVHSLYKKAFKKTYMQDVIESRIQHSRHLLAYSNQPVNAIATACGYSNTEHFCRQFKETTGMSPLQYRKSKRLFN